MSCEPADDRRDEIERLGDQVRGAWRALEDRGFPPEAAGWPFIEPDLGAAIGAALDCLIRTREDLIRRPTPKTTCPALERPSHEQAGGRAMSWWNRKTKTKKLRRPQRVRAASHRWGWWFSSDAENYSGPFRTREDAIATARAEDCGEWHNVDGVGRFYLLEARQGPIALWAYTDSESVMERVMEAVDDEYGGEDGIEWDNAWPAAADRRLEVWIRRVVRFWQWWHGIEVRTWAFTNSRNAETYTWVKGF